jgi:hypothetical protein
MKRKRNMVAKYKPCGLTRYNIVGDADITEVAS